MSPRVLACGIPFSAESAQRSARKTRCLAIRGLVRQKNQFAWQHPCETHLPSDMMCVLIMIASLMLKNVSAVPAKHAECFTRVHSRGKNRSLFSVCRLVGRFVVRFCRQIICSQILLTKPFKLDPTMAMISIRFNAQQISKRSSNTPHPQQIYKKRYSTRPHHSSSLALGRKTLSISTFQVLHRCVLCFEPSTK